ncbi:MAG: homoserine dehydrogenase [bacterium]|nr:homoserine dehydrogenase [bacterium]
MKSINIGLVGFGTIGSGVYTLLQQNASIIKERTGYNFAITKICDLDVDRVSGSVKDIAVTGNWEEVATDKNVDVVVELIGGIEPAKSILLTAMKEGKSVVTANKKLLAEEGTELFKTAAEKNLVLGFEAAVAGGIPCILALKTGLVSNRMKSVTGILNGTTNYILTKMEDEGLSFDAVLKDAQEKGFAEADPTFDIEGFDAGHKIALLAMLAYNKKVDFSSIPIEGITKITQNDISYARDMGYRIKLLGIARLVNDKLDIRVHPAMIPEKTPLASVRNEFNAVMFNGDMTGPVVLNGKGAGSDPTASAVMSDIIQIARTEGKEFSAEYCSEDARLISPEERVSRYYMKILTEDRSGILSKISGALDQYNISIASVIQKEYDSDFVPITIMTHNARENDMLQAVTDIEGFNFVNGEVILIRIEDSLDSGEDNE